MCTLFLALFLALCKRRAEMVLLLDKSSAHRKSLGDYSVDFMDQLIVIAAGCSILSYSFYVLLSETIAKAGNRKDAVHDTTGSVRDIPLSVPGAHQEGRIQPEKILLKDAPFVINMLIYVAAVVAILYFR